VVAEAKAAFGRKAEGELAVLVHDSLIEQDDPAADHRLRFEHPRLAIELHVSALAGGSSVTGRVDPPGPPSAQLETDGSEATSIAQIDGGVFTFQDVPHSLVRIILPATGDDRPIHTDWFRI
jgi:hypothetical protein